MRILVFGATGSVGSVIIEQALEQDHQVTAFSRSASKLEASPDLRIAEGDVLNYESVEKAVPNHDAVLIALGAGSKGIIRSKGTKNIIRAMEQVDIRRLICLSTLGSGDSWERLTFFWKYIMFGIILRKAYADHQRQEQYIKDSNLDWTVVRAGAFTDGKLTGEYKHGLLRNDNPKFKISRADVADFMLRQLQDNTYLHRTPGITY